MGLFEREDELAALRSAVAAAHDGHGHVVLVSAPAGVGKSSLLAAARTMATAQGMRPLAARGSELEREFPFGAVRQLLDPLVLAGHVGQPWPAPGADSARLDPWGVEAGVGDAGYAQLHGAYWMLANAAQDEPLVLLVDDAHWLDPASLRFLDFLARRLDALRVLLLVAFRSGELGVDELSLARLGDHPSRVLRPQPLSADGVAAMVADRLATSVNPLFARACSTTTGGNPFYLRALLAEMGERAVVPDAGSAHAVLELSPPLVAHYLLRRLSALPAEATHLARAVAVMGDNAAPAHLGELAALDLTRLAEIARALAGVAIFAATERASFAHPIAQRAVYSAIPATERLGLHGRALRALLRDDAPPEQVAAHLLRMQPGSHPEAVQLLRRAADEALLRGAVEAAAGYLRRALEEPLSDAEQAELLVALGRCEAHAGLPDAELHLRNALGNPRLSAEARASASIALARLLVAHGLGPQAADVLDEQAERLGSSPRLEALLLAELLGIANIDLGVRAAVGPRAQQLVYDEITDKELATAVASSRTVELTLAGHDAAAAARWAERALAGNVLRAEAMRGGQNFIYVNLCLIMAERFDVATVQLDAALAGARSHGSAAPFVIMCVQRGLLGYRTGALRDAEADLRTALEAARLVGYRPLEFLALTGLADVLVETGDASEVAHQLAGPMVDELAAATPQLNSALEARGRLRIALGDVEAGVADVLRAGQHFLGWGLSNPSIYRWRSGAALGLAAMGERDRAVALAREELELARRWGSPRALGIAMTGVGLLAEKRERLEVLQEAAAVLAESGGRLEYARALAHLGSTLHGAGRLPEARTTLRRGLEVATACGATQLCVRLRSELRAAGGRSRAPRSTGADALTPSERRIAMLAVAGATNAAIAQSLFITVKTVEMHLSNSFRKLGVPSRSELGAALDATHRDRLTRRGGA